jgi:hypothetical protein
MNKTPEELVRELRDVVDDFTIPTVSWQARAEWHTRLRACIAAVEAALARPPAGAVGRLVEHLNANADDFNRWPMEMKSLIAAVEAERAGERVVTFHGRSEDDVHSFTAGGCRNGLNEIAISLVFGTQPPEGSRWAILRLPDPPKPKVLPFVKTVGEWHLIVCGVPTCSYYCYTRTFPSAWKACPSCGAKFAPRDLPSGEEAGG